MKHWLTASVLAASLIAPAVQALTFSVDTVIDAVDKSPGDGVCETFSGQCSLRAAVMEANAFVGRDTIRLPAGTYRPSLGSINEDEAEEGDFDIYDDVTIIGAARDTTLIDGHFNDYRLFEVHRRSGSSFLPTLMLQNLTLTKGLEKTEGSCLSSEGIVYLENVRIHDCGAGSTAVLSTHHLHITNSLIDGNYRGVDSKGGETTVRSSVFTKNVSTQYFGGLRNYNGRLWVEDSQFTENQGEYGGAIVNTGTGADATILNTDFENNSARTKGGAVLSSSDITIKDSSFIGNVVDNTTSNTSHGGALSLGGTLRAHISDVYFENNKAIGVQAKGGAIFNITQQHLSVFKRVTLKNNHSDREGGGLHSEGYVSGESVYEELLLSGNTAGQLGGGAVLKGTATLRNSLVTGNSAAQGGGVYVSASKPVTIENTTITANSASDTGDGLYAYPNYQETINIKHSTIVGNETDSGGVNLHATNNARVRLFGSIVASGAKGTNCVGSIESLGYNLENASDCRLDQATDLSNTDSGLQALGDNGGFTPSLAPDASSAAIGRISASLCPDTDQRMHYRKNGNACDVGAVESGSNPIEAGKIHFQFSEQSLDESSGLSPVVLKRTGGSQGAVRVSLQDTFLGTATPAITTGDYAELKNIWIDWVDGDSSDKTFDLFIKNDSYQEGNEDIILALRSALGGATLDPSPTAYISLIDDDVDPGFIFITDSRFTVGEADSAFEVTIKRGPGSFGDVSILLSAIAKTASAGSDFASFSERVSFNAGQTEKTVSISILDDDLVETDETFELALSAPEGGAKLSGNGPSLVTIIDDEVAPTSQFDLVDTNFEVAENSGQVTITIVRSEDSSSAASVRLATKAAEAKAGEDYETFDNLVSFAVGETEKSISIDITNDEAVEDDETFEIQLVDPSENGALGSVISGAVTIIDDDELSVGAFEFGAASYEVSEDGVSLSITILRKNGSLGEAQVSLSAETGTALADKDYVDQLTTLSFADGEVINTVSIPIVDDGVVENDETFTLRLGSPTGAAELGNITSALVTITDDDEAPVPGIETTHHGLIVFSTSLVESSEAESTVSVALSRTEGSDGEVSVVVSTRDGTAVAGTDFDALNQTVNFADGQITASVTIHLIDDSEIENNESFSVGLSNPGGGAQLGSLATAEITLLSDDREQTSDSEVTASSSEEKKSGGGGSLSLLMLLPLGLIGWRKRLLKPLATAGYQRWWGM